MSNTISLQHFRKNNFQGESFTTDPFYCGLANLLLKQLKQVPNSSELPDLLLLQMSYNLARYMEDVVSDLGVWRAFTEVSQQRYGWSLPYYDLSDIDEYYPDELHLQDVRFLIWHTIQRHRKSTFINPENPFLKTLAEAVMALLEKKYDEAPVNDELKRIFYHLKAIPRADWVFHAREVTIWLRSVNYLTLDVDFTDHIDEIVESDKSRASLDQKYYHATARTVATETFGPLDMLGFEWFAAMCRTADYADSDDLARLLDTMEIRRHCIYQITHIGDTSVTLATSDTDNLQVDIEEFTPVGGSDMRRTLQHHRTFGCILLRWDGHWMPFGESVWYEASEPFDKYVELQEEQKHTAQAVLDRVDKVYGARRLFYIQNIDHMDEFQRTLWGKEFPVIDKSTLKHFPKDMAVALWLESDTGDFDIIPGADRIVDTHNPYYDPQKSPTSSFELLYCLPMAVPKAGAVYMAEQGCFCDTAVNSVFGLEHGRALVQRNLRFLIDYFYGMGTR